ncbi:6-phosphogluconolactonase [Rhodococcus antarcticus]|uniref:6-phosphogluconolactonase n=1 Tax=Rhodococcus antarcticus TaxID=2987751 RepID=A0ABY6P3D4_9NOCA|nr:6-phosphogluconolactonase [Rhodococcus antarcticus]UZJ26169.1 6-phosphogluconolactonase [Rhodococcus antarcticus]
MSTDPRVVVHPDPELLAAALAARVLTALVDAQAARGSASFVVTGGGTGTAVLEQLRRSPGRDAVDWSRVDVYWGDERYLPGGDPARNETQARAALLDHVPVDPSRVFAMAPSDGPLGDDPDAAAAAYARTLADRSPDGTVPRFDVLLLGIGPEGHVASVFPDSPAVHEQQLTVVAVRDCPKPPPTRISMTLPTVRAAAHVWLCVAGAGKAEAVHRALSGAAEVDLPAAGARGLESTIWVLDTAAAGGLAPS